MKDWIVAYLIPRFVLRAWRALKHPVDYWHERKHLKWATNIKPGDLVCDCRGRHLRVLLNEEDDLTLEDNSHCSAMHCCCPIADDNSCHVEVEAQQ